MLQFHSRMQNVIVEQFERVLERDAGPDHPSFDLGFVPGARGRIEGLEPADRADVAARSQDVDLGWRASAAADLAYPPLTADLLMGPSGRLRGRIRRLDRLEVTDTPLHPLPPADWNKGMTR